MIHREDRDTTAVLRLEHGKASALDIELLEKMIEVLDELPESGVRSVVITGSGSIFSAGVDLFRVLDGGRAYLERFVPLLCDALEKLFTLPLPVVAATNGHAIAGGCIIVCACDYRMMAEGDGRIGVPELYVGVPFPSVALEIVRFAVGGAHFHNIVLGGKTFSAKEALRLGLVDELAPAESLLEQACAHANRLASIPREVFSLAKWQNKADAVQTIRRRSAEDDAAVTDLWLAPETAARIADYMKRTVGKRS